jgi:Ser/Thr protein kinase RdoA (MazF antagonist)
MGHLLGRLHAVGEVRPFRYRPRLDLETFGTASAELLAERFVPPEFRANYRVLTGELLQGIDEAFTAVSPRFIRVHGDCHAGNVLWRSDAPHLVDLDDARLAPAVQDLWLMLSGDRARQTAQLEALLDGYLAFRHFEPRELRLVEALRALRILHYSGWLASRWDDPAFPVSFPWFDTPRYWNEHILQLREQIAALREPPLEAPA